MFWACNKHSSKIYYFWVLSSGNWFSTLLYATYLNSFNKLSAITSSRLKHLLCVKSHSHRLCTSKIWAYSFVQAIYSVCATAQTFVCDAITCLCWYHLFVHKLVYITSAHVCVIFEQMFVHCTHGVSRPNETNKSS